MGLLPFQESVITHILLSMSVGHHVLDRQIMEDVSLAVIVHMLLHNDLTDLPSMQTP